MEKWQALFCELLPGFLTSIGKPELTAEEKRAKEKSNRYCDGAIWGG